MYYWCAPDIPRAKSPSETKAAGDKIGLRGEIYSAVREAYAAACMAARTNDLIFIGGSSYVVGDLLAGLK